MRSPQITHTPRKKNGDGEYGKSIVGRHRVSRQWRRGGRKETIFALFKVVILGRGIEGEPPNTSRVFNPALYILPVSSGGGGGGGGRHTDKDSQKLT